MKKLIIFVTFIIFTSFTYARLAYVTDFEYNSINFNTGNLRQDTNLDLLGNSCGPMSLLAIYNYYTVENTGKATDFVSNSKSVESAIDGLYSYLKAATVTSIEHRGYSIDISYDNGDKFPVTAIWELSYIAETKAGWDFTAEFKSSKNYTTALNSMINQLYLDRPTIVLTKGYYSVQHFMVVYYVNENSNTIKYYDPWTGNLVIDELSNFKKNWASTSKTYNYMAVY